MSVGKRLKNAREAKGLSIDDIKNKSKIKKSYLEALENDNYKKLPGEVYTKVYIRGYAKIVDLNPQELLSEYENEKNKDRKIEEENGNQRSVKNDHVLNKDSILKVILGIILVLILVLLSYNIFFRTDQNQNNTASNSPQTEITQQEKSSNDTLNNNENNTSSEQTSINQEETNSNNNDKVENNEGSSNNSETETENTTEQNQANTDINNSDQNNNTNQSENGNNEQEQQPLVKEETKELTIIAKEKSWLQVTVDGELKFQGFINTDETMTHNGSDSIRIKIGNGIAVQVEYEGEILGPFGKRGEVIIKEFDIEN